jgi:hypothetical protein
MDTQSVFYEVRSWSYYVIMWIKLSFLGLITFFISKEQ